jgi:hypothetical protein
MAARIRLTGESIANLLVAEKITTERVKGGWKGKVSNQHGSEYLRNRGGIAIYKTRDALTRAAKRHNEVITVDNGILPSPSMRPKQKSI